MPSSSHLLMVARDLKRQLNNLAFKSFERTEITELIRQVSREPETRMKKLMGKELEHALLNQAVRCYPLLENTTTGDAIRLFHTPSVVANLVDVLSSPSPETDRELADIMKKVKGEWNWGDRIY